MPVRARVWSGLLLACLIRRGSWICAVVVIIRVVALLVFPMRRPNVLVVGAMSLVLCSISVCGDRGVIGPCSAAISRSLCRAPGVFVQ